MMTQCTFAGYLWGFTAWLSNSDDSWYSAGCGKATTVWGFAQSCIYSINRLSTVCHEFYLILSNKLGPMYSMAQAALALQTLGTIFDSNWCHVYSSKVLNFIRVDALYLLLCC